MKASNSRDATPGQFLEHLRQQCGIEHARRIRDKMGWRLKPSAIVWTLRYSWVAWAAAAGAVLAWLADIAVALKGLTI